MNCKKCGNLLIEYHNGNESELICPVCDEAPATQNDNLIEFDSNVYVVRVLPLAEYSKEQMKKVASVCGCNILEAKNILESHGKTFPAMDVLDTRALKEKLDSLEVQYEITPKFNW